MVVTMQNITVVIMTVTRNTRMVTMLLKSDYHLNRMCTDGISEHACLLN